MVDDIGRANYCAVVDMVANVFHVQRLSIHDVCVCVECYGQVGCLGARHYTSQSPTNCSMCCWQLVERLVSSSPSDENNIMLEVSAGVGGQEAMLFTAEVFNMYVKYAAYKGWQFDLVTYNLNGIGEWFVCGVFLFTLSASSPHSSIAWATHISCAY